jgi:hypothetical protein
MHPVCCPALHSTSLTATRVLVYTFRTQGEPNCLSVWLSQPRFFSDHLRVAVLSREAIDEACSDHTKMDVVVPAHVVTGSSIILSAGHHSGFPEYSCSSLSETKIIPSPNHCAGGQPESPCPALSYRVPVGAGCAAYGF